MLDTILEIKSLCKKYQGVTALNDVSIQVARGSITSLIGPNGSGKSTLIDCITGFQIADGGSWYLNGESITGKAPWQIVTSGLRRTFQTVRLYDQMSIYDNLKVALQGRTVRPWFRNLWVQGYGDYRDELIRDQIHTIAKIVKLSHILHLPAEAVSYGQQKLVSLAAALMGDPGLVVLDEPLAGVNPTLCNEIGELLSQFQERGFTFLLVEHNMDFVMRMSDSVVVLDQGRVLTHGLPEEVQADPRVLEAYIGVPVAAIERGH